MPDAQEKRLRETNYEERRMLEHAAYNEELDLWNTTLLRKLEREGGDRILMGAVCRR